MKFPFVLAFPQAHALLLTVKQLELLSCICGFCCINSRQSGYHQRPLKLKASGALAAACGGDSRGPGLLITSVTALCSYHDSFWADSRCPGEEKGLFLTHTEALSRLTEGLKQWTLVTWSSLLLKRSLLQIQIVFPLAYNYSPLRLGFSSGSDSKESVCNAGDLGLIPELGRSPGEGSGYPLQYACLRIPWREELHGLQSMGLQRVRHDQVTNTFTTFRLGKGEVWVHILPGKQI